MSETSLERHYRETLELVSGYAANRRHSIYCDYIEKFIITRLKEGQKIEEKKKQYTKPRYDKVYVRGIEWLDSL